VSLAVTEAVQKRVGVKTNSHGGKADGAIQQLYLNPEVPDASQRLNLAYYKMAMLHGWNALRADKLPSQADLIINDNDTDEVLIDKAEKFIQRAKGGEDLTFQVPSFTGKDKPNVLKPVDPAKGIIKVELPSLDETQVIIAEGSGMTMWVKDGHLVMGTYNANSEGLVGPTPTYRQTEPMSVLSFEAGLLQAKVIIETLKNGPRTALPILTVENSPFYKVELLFLKSHYKTTRNSQKTQASGRVPSSPHRSFH
jgi:hypothetical protein